MIQVVIADGQELFAEGLALVLAKKHGFSVMGTVMDAVVLLAKLRQSSPDILILDRDLKGMDAKDLLNTLTEMIAPQKIIYLSISQGSRQLYDLGTTDVGGFLTKDCVVAELAHAIQIVHEGKQYFSRELDINNLKKNLLPGSSINGKAVEEILTEKEQQILRLICQEYRTEDIARLLSLSVPSVEGHRKKLRKKLGVSTNVGLALAAYKQGLIK